jgi:hypothetical protein
VVPLKTEVPSVAAAYALKAAPARLEAAFNSVPGPKPAAHPTRAPVVAEPKASSAGKGDKRAR